MRNRHKLFAGLGTMLFAAALVAATAPTAMAQTETKVSDVLSGALKFYNEGEFDKGIDLAGGLLQRKNLTSQDSIATFEVLSILTYAKGQDYQKQSYEYLDKIAKVGPCILHLPHDIWPAQLRDKWYDILKAKQSLACPEESRSGVKTIAIMEFDNFSIGRYQEELGALGKGLADFFEHDFRKISAIKVVERDKINFVLKEHELQKSGAVDETTAVRAGKILGARFMVFGSITQLDPSNTRMVVKVVSVETSEIIASVDKEGRPMYTKLEKELVEELAKKLDVTLSDSLKAQIKEGGTESLDATALYAKGLEYMDRYDYKKAYESFRKAYELDPNFAEAKRKMEIYQPLAS
ncbi:MAG TPA: CsgG/HfaB family protein [Candidatus Deferrimicrobium sp.]|nr:CsgG/HfaB family protein [Candidatus Deferrimicrobium sp.]